MTNVLLFGVWYWQLDRGGPVARATDPDVYPDFVFPQMTDPRFAPADWHPGLIDYLYVSLTNATAFSPTDTMPLTPIAKLSDERPVADRAGHDRSRVRAGRQHPLTCLPPRPGLTSYPPPGPRLPADGASSTGS